MSFRKKAEMLRSKMRDENLDAYIQLIRTRALRLQIIGEPCAGYRALPAG